MDGKYGYRVWLPIIVTVIVWIGLVFVIAALASRMWADLIGLFYLLASPFIYRGLESVIGVDTSGTEATVGLSPTNDAGS